MLSYLTDATIIWSISLLLYLLLFRKTTFHNWNRAYLLLTLAAGLLLPLYEAPVPETLVQLPVYRLPVARFSTAKAEVVQQVITHTKPAFTFSLWTLYCVGCAVAFSLYLWEARKIFKLVSGAWKNSCSGIDFYETGNAHPPFSFFGKIFLKNSIDYTPEDLQLILQHEVRHGRLRHSVDVMVLAFLRIALWFHPLIYVYDFLLKQLHEFESDAFAREVPEPYGQLLLQEATANPFPLVHSFHHSPLKNRILMLTRNTTPALLKLQYLLVLPLLLLAVEACQKKEATAQKPAAAPFGYHDDTSFVFKGNRFYQKASMPFYWDLDSNAAIPVEPGRDADSVDPTKLLGEPNFYVTGDIYQMNEEPVYAEDKVDVAAQYKGNFKNAYEEFLQRIEPALSQLPDGKYSVSGNNVVISKEGRLVFYQGFELGNQSVELKLGETNLTSVMQAMQKPLPENIKAPVNAAIEKALEEGFDFKPALLNGKPVNSTLFSLYDADFRPVTIFVRKGNVSIVSEQDLTQTAQDAAQAEAVVQQIKKERDHLLRLQEDVQREYNRAREADVKKFLAATKEVQQQAKRRSQQYWQELEEAIAEAKKAQNTIQ